MPLTAQEQKVKGDGLTVLWGRNPALTRHVCAWHDNSSSSSVCWDRAGSSLTSKAVTDIFQRTPCFTITVSLWGHTDTPRAKGALAPASPPTFSARWWAARCRGCPGSSATASWQQASQRPARWWCLTECRWPLWTLTCIGRKSQRQRNAALNERKRAQ